MKKIIVSDASPLIALAKLDCLDLLLNIFSEIHIPEAVYLEAAYDKRREDAKRIDCFIKQHVIVHENKTNNDYRLFRNVLDEGESQALSLATELNCAILIDEHLGRQIAKRHSLVVIGVMGVLLQAKMNKKILVIRPLIEQLLQNDYRLSDKVINIVLHKAGEYLEK
ncbi:MAG: DUF3368 domain-containing protein [Methylococcaceae bacterium]|nr:DUF3368 domain-containing protein [Methylococcaceae bacterium]